MRWCLCTQKSMPRQFSPSPELMPKLWHWSRGLKIDLVSIFLFSHTNVWYATQLYDKILARLQNMGAQLPLSRIFHPNPCARRTYPILGCVLRAHGFGWQIRVFGSSTSVFRPQSCQIAHVRWAYRLLRESTVLIKFSKNSLCITIFWQFKFHVFLGRNLNMYYCNTIIKWLFWGTDDALNSTLMYCMYPNSYYKLRYSGTSAG